MSYRGVERIVTHTVNRIEIETEAPFEDLRTRFESEVPQLETDRLQLMIAEGANWDEFVRAAAENGPHGFMIFWSTYPTSTMQFAGSNSASATYLMGNYAIAARMFRHDPGVMLYAPLRLEMHSDRAAKTVLSVDQPSSHFSSFGVNKISQVGFELDRQLGDLLEALDLPRPSVLRL
jgi:hypothetical protein